MVIVRCIFIVIVIGVLISTIKYSIFVTDQPSMYFHSAYIPTCKEYPFLMWKKRDYFSYFYFHGKIFPCSWKYISMFLEMYFHTLGNIFLDVKEEISVLIFPCSSFTCPCSILLWNPFPSVVHHTSVDVHQQVVENYDQIQAALSNLDSLLHQQVQ